MKAPLWVSRPAAHPSAALGCPSLHSSLRPSGPVLWGTPCPPPTTPVQLQMPADAEWYLRPSKTSARGVMGATRIGPGACGWASGRWADSEPGWARYGQVCPGRAGTARLCHDIQVFPLPVLSLAVRTESDHKHSN